MQLGDRRLLTVDRAVEIVDHRAHGADHRRGCRCWPRQQRALIVETAPHAGDGSRARVKAAVELLDGGYAIGREPTRQDALLRGGDALEVGQLPLNAQKVDVGSAQIAAQKGVIGLQLDLTLVEAVGLGTRFDAAGFVGQPHAVAPGPHDEFTERARSRVGIELGRFVDRAQAYPGLQQCQPLVQRVELAGDGNRALPVEVDGLLHPIAQLTKLGHPQRGRICLQTIGWGRRLLGQKRDLTVERADLLGEEIGRSWTPVSRVRLVSASNRAWRRADIVTAAASRLRSSSSSRADS